MALPPFRHFGTDAIHAGQPYDPSTGAVITPISLSTTFAQRSPGSPCGAFAYGRSNNPTRAAYEQCIAKLEGARHGVALASGMAATAMAIHLLAPGDQVLACDDMYGGTSRYFRTVAAPNNSIEFLLDPLTDSAQVGSLVAQHPRLRMVWLETPTNPLLKVIDIAAVVAAVRAAREGVLVVVDNTFLSPYFQRPLSLGADLVVHSVTKYINGHSDVLGGMLVTDSDELHARLRRLQNSVGAVQAPFDSFLAMRGVKTLHLRMRQHAANAMAVATFLEAHPKVERVLYPGLASHPDHELAKRQMAGFGGMISFYCRGGLAGATAFLEHTRIFQLAESLGGVESLAGLPVVMTHASVPEEQRIKVGVTGGLVRLSVGIEDEEDLIDDLANALDHVEV
mmetsp:Transcript_8571/g.35716  ORF Transcript_8571/g.35716 Transcript_8571/m.35716 type:complete len:395 (+) Transcript_8571:3-1187(+)